jgi:hypothetical protein
MYDPINQTADCSVSGLRTIQFKSAIDTIAIKAETLFSNAQSYSNALVMDSVKNQSLIDSNNNLTVKNKGIVLANLAIDSMNRVRTILDSLQFKSLLFSLSLSPLPPSFGYTAGLKNLSDSLASLWANFSGTCSIAIDENKSFIDMKMARMASIDTTIQLASMRATKLLIVRTDSIRADSTYNVGIALANDAISRYNDSLKFLKQSQRYTQIKTVADLQTAIKLAKPGDTLALLQKNFTISSGGISGLANSGTYEKPIVIMGDPSDTTVISTTTGVVLSNNNYFNFSNLTFSGSNNSGFKVTQSNGVNLENCVFTGNKIHGIEILDCQKIQLTDCRIMHNAVNGIRVSTQPGAFNQVYLDNVLVVNNDSNGIEVVNTNISAKNLTVSNNGRSGLYISDPAQNVFIVLSLLTFNSSFGISYPFQLPGLTLDNTMDIFGNAKGQVSTDSLNVYDYRKVNPPYVDAAHGDFSIASGGTIDSLQQPPWLIIIGYRGK